MLPSSMLPMPAIWGDLLGELGPVFRRRSTYQLFVLLACGMILAGRRTVVAMAAAAGIGGQFRRACWFFSGAVWDLDDLGLAVARLIVKYLVPAGAPVTVAVDGTFFRRWGRKVFQARWAYDGSAQGAKKIAFGNTWAIAAIVVKLPFCSSPVALPVLSRRCRQAPHAMPVVHHQDRAVTRRHARLAAPRVPQSPISRHPAGSRLSHNH